MSPLSVAASPDGGFTVVGYGNFGTDANDAFAQHFVYKPISAVISHSNSLLKAKSLTFNVRLAGVKAYGFEHNEKYTGQPYRSLIFRADVLPSNG